MLGGCGAAVSDLSTDDSRGREGIPRVSCTVTAISAVCDVRYAGCMTFQSVWLWIWVLL